MPHPVIVPALAALFLFPCAALASPDETAAEQARLDEACEVAREKKLAPERKQLIEQCVANGERPDRAACERFYADYGNQAGKRAPLYMDLPACVKAFAFRRGGE